MVGGFSAMEELASRQHSSDSSRNTFSFLETILTEYLTSRVCIEEGYVGYVGKMWAWRDVS